MRAHLPLVAKEPTLTPTPTPTPIIYGWKGIGHPPEASVLGASSQTQYWGLQPDWWYDWGYEVVYGETAFEQIDVARMTAMLEAGLHDPKYVPMVWGPASVGAGPAPAVIQQLAHDNPGRVWLIFNEPDNEKLGGCGKDINDALHYISDKKWLALGNYIAEQYKLYCDAIKDPIFGDPTARVFGPGMLYLPMPTLPGQNENRALPIWDSFLNSLGQARLDGIALHAYPNHDSTYHAGCYPANGEVPEYFLDPLCIQRALGDAYDYLQSRAATTGKPIWVTETGVLYDSVLHPDWSSRLPWNDTRDEFMSPMIQWFASNAGPGRRYRLINGVAWFSSHTRDFLASNLLVPTPVAPPGWGSLTALGATWANATCPGCACPGYDCH